MDFYAISITKEAGKADKAAIGRAMEIREQFSQFLFLHCRLRTVSQFEFRLSTET
ncbi:hypothetical protein [Mesorhizobium sp. IMUNJ 23232]|uniref:hypothetical protein n=1 Tax=Mesorhizobium sp. IMUNJ 23232 TaxID=3376064 RepID=UPI00379C5874